MSAPLEVALIEIRVRDLDVALAFYRDVFGWGTLVATPTMVYVDTGQPPLVCLMVDDRMPLGVGNNCVVDELSAVLDRCRALGGRIVIEGQGGGPFAGTLDPWGNELFFWQPTVARPRHRSSRTHPLVFLEIATPDFVAAQHYYAELCGWSFWERVGARGFATADGCGFPGGIALTRASTHGTRNYVEVASLDAIMTKLVVHDVFMSAPFELAWGGRFAVFADRDGNRLGLYEPDGAVH